MSKSKNDVLDMFEENASDIGLDDDSSSIIVANLNATTLPMCIGTPIEEIETDDITLIFFMVDQSPSMIPVEAEVIYGFNEIMIPGLKGGSREVVSTFEIGGLAFNERITPLWGAGFHKIEDVPILTTADYNANSGGATALNQAVLDGFTATSIRTTEIIRETGIMPKVFFVIVSDGANNQPPMDPSDIKQVADSLSNEIFVKAFAGFKTYENVDFEQVAASIGFGKPFKMEKDEYADEEDMKREFRHLFGVMSSSIVSASKMKVTVQSSDNFWQK